MKPYITLIEESINNAENYISKITDGIKNIEGMSGLKTRHFYNNLLQAEDSRYLEIGTWKGSSVCSAMCGNKATVVCVDNWSEFGGREEFLINFNTYKGENNASFIEKDCFTIDTSLLPKFNIYTYDGDHKKNSHYNSLAHFYNCLDNTFIFIVDDWNWEDVRNGTFEAITKLQLRILYQKEIRLTFDNSHTPQHYGRQTWWNGIYICLLQKTRSQILLLDYKLNTSELYNSLYYNPYTIFYEGLFSKFKNNTLKLAEFNEKSIPIFSEYFQNSTVHHFDAYQNSEQFDIIINDITYNFTDQISAIENTYKSLRPGGILLIGNITQYDYTTALHSILQHFADYYFIDISRYGNTCRLFVLVRSGLSHLQNINKLTIITPSYRTNNLQNLKDSINFDYVEEWIIVYDGSKIKKNPNIFSGHPKIKEYIYTAEGISGNPQRNYALTKVSNPNTSLYYLDDDNIIHNSLYNLLNILDNRKMYTFRQVSGLSGDNVNVFSIDTAMCIIPFRICKDIRWLPDKYEADGYYIKQCYDLCYRDHIFVNNDLCYYNKLLV